MLSRDRARDAHADRRRGTCATSLFRGERDWPVAYLRPFEFPADVEGVLVSHQRPSAAVRPTEGDGPRQQGSVDVHAAKTLPGHTRIVGIEPVLVTASVTIDAVTDFGEVTAEDGIRLGP